jgi:hypothetical protein
VLVWLALAWRFDWLCDDAFISFRYARNLAEGHGLTYNPPERIEGYSNFLWTVWLALCERLGVEVTLAARASSVACGLGVLVLLARLLHAPLALPAAAALAALCFTATLPPLAAWATSGLAPMPLALLLLFALERLVGDPERPRPVQAGLAAAAAALVRADGPLGVALVLGPVLALGLRDRRLLRPAATAVALALAAFGAHLAWRHGYYGQLGPNTARVKVDPSALTFERGAKYLGTFALSYPAVPLALLLALVRSPAARRAPPGSDARQAAERARAASSWSVVLGFCAYAGFVGGDFMAMGRFLVPALPFAALLLGRALRGAGSRVALAAGAVLAALSLLGAFDRHVTPRAWREACFFRWSADGFRTEHEQWQLMRSQAEQWTVLGRALALHTRPDQSLVHGTIGAVGYYSRLRIHDPFGLVNREDFRAEGDEPRRRSPGHHRRVPLSTFMQYEPTWLDAALVPPGNPGLEWPRWLAPGADFAGRAEARLLPLDGVPGAPPELVLRLIRNSGP